MTHPEGRGVVVAVADYVGSTAGILKFWAQEGGGEYIVVTESGIFHQWRKAYPEKIFIPAPPIDSTCGCNNCAYMKLVTPEKIYTCLRDETPEVVIPEEIRKQALGSLRAMLDLKKR